MGSADRRLVTAVTAPLLLRYGYLGSRSRRQRVTPIDDGVPAGWP
jgi:hypothetical protein